MSDTPDSLHPSAPTEAAHVLPPAAPAADADGLASEPHTLRAAPAEVPLDAQAVTVSVTNPATNPINADDSVEPGEVDAAARAEANTAVLAPPPAPALANQHGPKDMSPGACAELLKRHFPALFGGSPKPLKLRIQADIALRAPGVFGKPAMSAFFRRYTGSTGYLMALGKATQRFDLDGQPAGDLSEEHRQLARDELARRRLLSRERDQQARAPQTAKPGAEGDSAVASDPAAPGQPPAAPRGPRPDRQADRRPDRRPDSRADRRPEGRADAGPRGPRENGLDRDRQGPRDGRPAAKDQRPAPASAAPLTEAELAAQAQAQAMLQAERAAAFALREQARAAQALARTEQSAALAENAQAQQERLARQTLLRDFERSPLTLNNFCVLKRLSPELLTPMLAQARKEAAENPPPPQRAAEEWRGGAAGQQRRDGSQGGQRDARPGPRRDGPVRPEDRPAGNRSEPRNDARPARNDARPDTRPAGAPGSRPPGRPPSR